MARKKKTVTTKVESVNVSTNQTDAVPVVIDSVVENNVKSNKETVTETPAIVNVSTEITNKASNSSINVSSFNSANKVSKSTYVVETVNTNNNCTTKFVNKPKSIIQNEYVMPDKSFDKETNAKIMSKIYTVRTAFSMNMKRSAIKQTLTLDEIIRTALIYKNKFIGFVSTLDLDSVVNILNTKKILFEYHILTDKDIEYIIYRLKTNSEFAMKFPFRDD